ncbi:MAG: flagellar hook-basal body complex protein, partial [Deltaproteobacteria bacterium]|nr:flagellar hook-basal body complex protein [Deltaproteobacteria bacterium]
MTTYGEAMTVTGSNIANVNTLGYKSNRMNFYDLMATGIRGTDSKVGKGVMIGSVQADFSQGNLMSSTLNTDLAIDGDGFFTLKDEVGRAYYTRAGNFRYDKEGFLSTTEDVRVMGNEIDPQTGESVGFPKGIKLVGINSPPVPTGDGTNESGIKIAANLNADAPLREVEFDPTNVQAEMFNYSTSVTVVDDNGSEHVLNMVFRRLPDTPAQVNPATGQMIPGTEQKNRWSWYIVSDAKEFGGAPGVTVALGGGFMNFTA